MNKLFSELALKNVKKSSRDYMIYFFTLTLGTALFYTFSSLKDQFKVMQVNDTLSYASFTVGAMMMLSVFACVMIGFLIIYANRFLLKRRKKEFGIYIMLGMDEKAVTALMLKETIYIGLFSLVTGNILGVFLSQGLMALSVRITGLGPNGTRFLFSPGAVLSSIVFTVVLFLVVHLFQRREMKKLQLIDLLKAEKQNEEVGGKTFLNSCLFLASILLTLVGYYWMIKNPAYNLFNAVGIGVILITAGTILFFFSVAGILLKVFENVKGVYYRGLNMFVLRQLSSKIKSSGLSIAVICMLLFLSVTALSIGPAGGQSTLKGIHRAMPYDASIKKYYMENYETGMVSQTQNKKVSVADRLLSSNFPVDEIFREYGEMSIYIPDNLKEDTFLLDGYSKNSNNEQFGKAGIQVVGIDDYNQYLAIQGKSPVTLKNDEFVLTYNIEEYKDIYQYYEKNHAAPVSLNGYELKMKPGGLYEESLEIQNVLMNNGTMIVPQKVLENLALNRSVYFGNFRDENGNGYEQFTERAFELPSDLQWTTKEDTFTEVTMGNMIFSYAGLYLGICFLITAGAVLGLQQLSQAADNEKRFAILKKLGTKEKMLKKAVRTQVLVYFGLPFILAGVHSFIIITGIFRMLTNLTGSEKLQYVILSGGIVLAVYGIYFLGTYFGSRRILQEKNTEE